MAILTVAMVAFAPMRWEASTAGGAPGWSLRHEPAPSGSSECDRCSTDVAGGFDVRGNCQCPLPQRRDHRSGLQRPAAIADHRRRGRRQTKFRALGIAATDAGGVSSRGSRAAGVACLWPRAITGQPSVRRRYDPSGTARISRRACALSVRSRRRMWRKPVTALFLSGCATVTSVSWSWGPPGRASQHSEPYRIITTGPLLYTTVRQTFRRN